MHPWGEYFEVSLSLTQESKEDGGIAAASPETQEALVKAAADAVFFAYCGSVEGDRRVRLNHLKVKREGDFETGNVRVTARAHIEPVPEEKAA